MLKNNYPWEGAAKRLDESDFISAAKDLGCEVSAIKAIWEVEASGNAFRYDGSLERRYEPHHFPGSGITKWRDSMKLSESNREDMLFDAYRKKPEAALDATSWGGPQIMGFNAEKAGFPSAMAMVEAMADSESAHLTAFVNFCRSEGLVTHLRALNWEAFALRYNGSGQVKAYAAKMESAYRRHSGKASPVVLRFGSTGAAVKLLQSALGIPADGNFGQQTKAAVQKFQAENGLKADGIVGAKTWSSLPTTQADTPKKMAVADINANITKMAGTATAVGGAMAAIGDALPDTAMNILMTGAAVAGVIAVGAWAFGRLRT